MKKSPIFLVLALLALFVTSCDDDDVPAAENEEETITNVTLTFTPEGGGAPVEATWVDADGEAGSGQPVLSDVTLAANTTYILNIDFINAIDPSDPESVTEEIEEEADAHMLFFGWTNNLFSDPTGDGNIGAGNRNDPVNYEDDDDPDGVGFPLGLETSWTTGAASSGTFRVLLAHQPDGQKTDTSDSTTGTPDVDITWEDVTVQ